MAANEQQQTTTKDVLMPFKMRTGRKRNVIWNYFTRYERQVYQSPNDTVPISKKLIAKCNKCDMVHCTNLDTMANHILFGDDIWAATAKKQAQDIINAATNRRAKRRRTLSQSNQENATIDHTQVCIVYCPIHTNDIIYKYHQILILSITNTNTILYLV